MRTRDGVAGCLLGSCIMYSHIVASWFLSQGLLLFHPHVVVVACGFVREWSLVMNSIGGNVSLASSSQRKR